jgi:methanogenic corrinoid protein MtbC1
MEKGAWQDYGDSTCAAEIQSGEWPFAARDFPKLDPSGLIRLIETDIVPSLVGAHRDVTVDRAVIPYELPAETVEDFTALVLVEEAPSLRRFLESLRKDGASVETLYLGLMSSTARRLGELWEDDIIDFTSATIALWRLQQLLRDFSPLFQNEAPKPSNGHRALLLSTPGEQHNFGLAMLGEFLFRDGWSIAGGPGLTLEEIRAIVKTQFFSVVGFTLSGDRGIAALTETIAVVRRHSCNRGIVVMVGGALFNQRPELVSLVGADSTAPDARQGALQAGILVKSIGLANSTGG